MKLVTYLHPESQSPRPGAIVGETVIDLGTAAGPDAPKLAPLRLAAERSKDAFYADP